MDRQARSAIVDVEFRAHCHEGINLSTDHPAFFKIPIRIFVLTNFFAEISNSGLHRPLCITGKWTRADGLRGNMREEMDTVMNKVDPTCFPLIIKRFEVPDKFLQDCVAISKVLWCDNGALKQLNPRNQFAVVFPVRSWKDVS
jgi:hypothetical protein